MKSRWKKQKEPHALEGAVYTPKQQDIDFELLGLNKDACYFYPVCENPITIEPYDSALKYLADLLHQIGDNNIAAICQGLNGQVNVIINDRTTPKRALSYCIKGPVSTVKMRVHEILKKNRITGYGIFIEKPGKQMLIVDPREEK